MENYKCSHCGKELPHNKFRPYYNGANGHYTWCLDCESMQQRWRYLLRCKEEGRINDTQQLELDKIEEIYKARKQVGLNVPKRPEKRVKRTPIEALDTELQRLKGLASKE